MIPFHAEARKARVGKDLLLTSWKKSRALRRRERLHHDLRPRFSFAEF